MENEIVLRFEKSMPDNNKKYIRSYTNDREYSNDYFFNNNVYDGCL